MGTLQERAEMIQPACSTFSDELFLLREQLGFFSLTTKLYLLI